MSDAQASMSVDDILNSIKSSVEEESARQSERPEGELELGGDAEAAMLEDLDVDSIVTDAGVGSAGGDEDDLIDIEAFAASGEEKPADADAVEAARDTYDDAENVAPVEMPEVAAEEVAPDAPVEEEIVAEPAVEEMAGEDDIDAMMAAAAEETPVEEAAPAEEVAADADVEAMMAEAGGDDDDLDMDALMGEIAAEGGDAAGEIETAQAEMEAEAAAAEEVAIEEPAASAPAVEAVAAAVEEKVVNGVTQHLKAIPSPNGLQVGFPVEVLAEALRPLVVSWVNDNLPEIVERLVKEELSRMAEGD